MSVAIETLKQRILACSNKIHRYTNRTQGFCENNLFRVDQRKFYENLCPSVEHDNDAKDYSSDFTDQIIQFWKTLWEDSKLHNTQAPWISNVAAKLCEIDTQQPIIITYEKVVPAVKN